MESSLSKCRRSGKRLPLRKISGLERSLSLGVFWGRRGIGLGLRVNVFPVIGPGRPRKRYLKNFSQISVLLLYEIAPFALVLPVPKVVHPWGVLNDFVESLRCRSVGGLGR
jgi:hypothetical protein